VQQFGKYRLLEPVAAGGMAEVWRAEAPGAEGFVKEVALKLIRGDHDARGDFVRMFIQEARLASRLSHANIVQVFDFDQVDGQYYIAMEMVRGRTLREVVERCRETGARFGVARAVHVCAEVARALAYAHHLEEGGRPAGLVHRDVSPQNVLVSFEGEVKLTDFGIARALGTAEATAPGTVKGKLAYMAPEQARGEPVDGRTDLFALGVMLWELCAGRRLFARDGDAATLAALLSAEPISPPSAWNELVPPALDGVVLAALERDAARRTASAEELAAALAAIRLQIAARHEDFDLRALMRRLWPDHRNSAPRAMPERTVRRPVPPGLAPPPAAQPGVAAAAEAATETVVRPAASGTTRRRVAILAAVAVLGLAAAWGGAGWRAGRGASDASSTRIAPLPDPLPSARGEGSGEGGASSTPPPSVRAEPFDSGRRAASAQDRLRVAESKSPTAKRSATSVRASPSAAPPASKAPGVVTVTSSPWAFVYVDGVDRGEAPLTEVRLRPGRHVFRAVNPHVGTDEAQVDLAPGEHWSWNARPHR
jgi:tRNA A-37 threonylcarbamoyl transferase component Bud32